MDKLNQHWTSGTIDNFVFQIASDFTLQLEKKLEAGPIRNKELAARLQLSAGRVSQVLNNPGNFKLRSMAEYAHALNMKVSVVAYEDGDPGNKKGPINSEIFYECWKRAGKPRDFFDLRGSLVIQSIHYYNVSPLSVGTKNTEKNCPQQVSSWFDKKAGSTETVLVQ
jgi:hypothetical protein